MTAQEIAAAMRRVEAVLRRRPEAGLHDDAPATASWQGSTRVVASHANGTRLATDMPGEFYMNDQGEGRTGWLAGVCDRIIGAALSAMHKDPARAWTLEELARAAGTSRSVLAERFQLLVGSSPMQYLTQWRMILAANLLRHGNAPLASIAADVGYQTDTAFSRPFRREFGAPPATCAANTQRASRFAERARLVGAGRRLPAQRSTSGSCLHVTGPTRPAAGTASRAPLGPARSCGRGQLPWASSFASTLALPT
jgi:AraC-like DNA-binding protein